MREPAPLTVEILREARKKLDAAPVAITGFICPLCRDYHDGTDACPACAAIVDALGGAPHG